MDDLPILEQVKVYVDVLDEFTYELPPEDYLDMSRRMIAELQALLKKEDA